MSIINNHRCYICNSVSSDSVETNVGDFKDVDFVRDPQNKNRVICVPCMEAGEENLTEIRASDDIYGWEMSYVRPVEISVVLDVHRNFRSEESQEVQD